MKTLADVGQVFEAEEEEDDVLQKCEELSQQLRKTIDAHGKRSAA